MDKDAYETIMFWLSLYPHLIGDQIIKEVVEADND